jgi:hypothetical protein
MRYLWRGKHLKDIQKKLYDRFLDEKYYGQTILNRPYFVIKDLDLIKQVMITNFDHFVNHVDTLGTHDEPFFRNLFGLKGI